MVLKFVHQFFQSAIFLTTFVHVITWQHMSSPGNFEVTKMMLHNRGGGTEM